jgi:hypothetical protein
MKATKRPREDQLDLHRVRGRRAARPPGARRASARTSSPACTAPSSCARCRCWRARAASRTSSPSPAAWPRTRRRSRRCAARQGELRRGTHQHLPDSIYTGRLGLFANSPVAPSPGGLKGCSSHDHTQASTSVGAVKTVLCASRAQDRVAGRKRNDRIRQRDPRRSPRRAPRALELSGRPQARRSVGLRRHHRRGRERRLPHRPLLRHDDPRARRGVPQPGRARCSTSARCTGARCASTSAAR